MRLIIICHRLLYILTTMLATDTTTLEAYPVSTMVNNPKNQGEGLIIKQAEYMVQMY